MSPFPHWPMPERFRTYEDAMTFLKKPDWRLCIPAFIEKDGKSMVNPEYRDAPYEQECRVYAVAYRQTNSSTSSA